jgi:tetratricopeptide (TPR) repeat protein
MVRASSPASMPSSALPAEQRDLLRILGYSYHHNGRWEQAAILFSALNALDPDDAFAAKSLASAYVRAGKADQALPLLDRLIERGDSFAITHLLRGQALEALGRLGEAARAMKFYVAARADEAHTKEE